MSVIGPLLLAINESPSHNIILHNIAYEYTTYRIPNGLHPSFIIPHAADLINLEYFHFKDQNLSLEQFKDIIKHCKCKLDIGGQEIIKYDFEILIELNQIQHVRDIFIVKIPQFLVKNIIFVALVYHEVKLEFDLTHEFSEIFVVTKLIFHETRERERLSQHNHIKMIQQLNFVDEINGTSEFQRVRVNGNNMTKGMFVIGDLNNIQELSLSINGYDIFKYDYAMLANMAHVVSDNIFYISFEGSNNYDNVSNDSLFGSINLSRVSSCTINFRLFETNEENQSLFKIYLLNVNILRYMSGMAGLWQEHIVVAPITPLPTTIPTITPSPLIQRLDTIATSTHSGSIEWHEEIKALVGATICPITREEIGNEYGTCTVCHNNISFTHLTSWLQINNTCPLCRSTWTNYVKYLRN